MSRRAFAVVEDQKCTPWRRQRRVVALLVLAAMLLAISLTLGAGTALAGSTSELPVEMTEEQYEEALYAAEVTPALTFPRFNANDEPVPAAPGEAGQPLKILELEIAQQLEEQEPLTEERREQVEQIFAEATQLVNESREETTGSSEEPSGSSVSGGEVLETADKLQEGLEKIREKDEKLKEKAEEAAKELEEDAKKEDKTLLKRANARRFTPNWHDDPAEDNELQTTPTLKRANALARKSTAVQKLDDNIVAPPGSPVSGVPSSAASATALQNDASPTLQTETAQLKRANGKRVSTVGTIEQQNTSATKGVTAAGKDAGKNVQTVVKGSAADKALAKTNIAGDAKAIAADSEAQTFASSSLKSSLLPASLSTAEKVGDDAADETAKITADAATDVAEDAIDPLMISQILVQGPQIIFSIIEMIEGAGPSSEEIMFEQIQSIKEMIAEVSKQIQSGFADVEVHLKELYGKIETDTELLKEANLNIARIRNELGQVQDGLDTLQADMYQIAATQRQETFQAALTTDIGYTSRAPAGQTLPVYQFEQGVGLFYTWGFDDPFNGISENPAINWPKESKEVYGKLTSSCAASKEEAAAVAQSSSGNCLNFNLDYLAHVVNENHWITGNPLQETLPNPEVWAAGGVALAQLLTENTEYVTKPVLNELTGVKSVGVELEEAMRRLSSQGPPRTVGQTEIETGSGVLNNALANYIERGIARGGRTEASLRDRLEAEENKFLSEDKRGGSADPLCTECKAGVKPEAAGKANDEGKPCINLWGGAEQAPENSGACPLTELQTTGGDPASTTRKTTEVDTVKPCQDNTDTPPVFDTSTEKSVKSPEEALTVKAAALQDPLPSVYANAWHLGLGRIGACYEDKVNNFSGGGPTWFAIDWYWYDNNTQKATLAMRVLIKGIWLYTFEGRQHECEGYSLTVTMKELWEKGGLSGQYPDCLVFRYEKQYDPTFKPPKLVYTPTTNNLEEDMVQAVKEATKSHEGETLSLSQSTCNTLNVGLGYGSELNINVFPFTTLLECEVNFPSPEEVSAAGKTRTECESFFDDAPVGVSGEVTRELECLQKEAYAAIAPPTNTAEELNAGNEVEVQQSAERLNGARALVDAYTRLALPRALAKDLALRSFVSGPGHLLDNSGTSSAGGGPPCAPVACPDAKVWQYFKREYEATEKQLPETDPAAPAGAIEEALVSEGAAALAVRLRNTITGLRVSPSGLRGQTDPLVSATIARLGLAETELAPIVAEGKPVDIKPPEIVGMPAVGATLRCLEGEWSGLPTPVPRYEWVQEGNSTPIGTGETYVVKLADVKHNVKCIVTEQNEDGEASAESKPLLVPVLANLAVEDLVGGEGAVTESKGVTITLELVIRNTGNVPLPTISFTSTSSSGCEKAPTGGVTSLKPTETTKYTCQMLLASYGKFTSQVWVKGEPPTGEGLTVERPSNTLKINVPSPAAIPVTVGAKEVRSHFATLVGTVNPQGYPLTQCVFEFAKNPNGGFEYPGHHGEFPPYNCPPMSGVGNSATSPVTEESRIPADLAAGTVYYFRICAANEWNGVLVCAETKTLETLAPFTPFVETQEATSVTSGAATLNGVVIPYGEPLTACEFEYGTSTSYGKTLLCPSGVYQGFGMGAPVQVSLPLPSLNVGTTYHFRLVSANVNGKAFGGDEHFTTSPQPPPVVTANAVTNYNATGATLEGSVNRNGNTIHSCEIVYVELVSTAVTTKKTCPTFPGSTTQETLKLTNLHQSTDFQFELVVTYASSTTKKVTTARSGPIYFETAGLPQVVGTLPEEVAAHTATVAGVVGTSTFGISSGACHFVITKPTGATYEEPCQPLPIAPFTTTPVSASLTKLEEGRKYKYVLAVSDTAGDKVRSSATPIEEFTTPKEGPPELVITPPATRNVGQTSAEVYASVNPHGLPTTCKVSYKSVGGSSTEVACNAPGPGTGGVAKEVSAKLTGLSPGTTYEVTFKVKNAKGEKFNALPLDFTSEGQKVIAFKNGKGEILQTGTAIRITSSARGGSTGPKNGGELFDCNISEFKGSIAKNDAGEIEITLTQMNFARGGTHPGPHCFSFQGEQKWGGGPLVTVNGPWTLTYKVTSVLPLFIGSELIGPSSGGKPLEEFIMNFPGPSGSPAQCAYQFHGPLTSELGNPGEYGEFKLESELSNTIGCPETESAANPTEQVKLTTIGLGFVEANGEGVSIE